MKRIILTIAVASLAIGGIAVAQTRAPASGASRRRGIAPRRPRSTPSAAPAPRYRPDARGANSGDPERRLRRLLRHRHRRLLGAKQHVLL